MDNSSRRTFLKKASLTGLGGISIHSLNKLNMGILSSDEKKEYHRFLFQGDSITDGNRGRNTDPNHIMGHGYAFSIASRVGAEFPNKKLEFFNRGISGNTITDLAARWQQDTLDLQPEVLSILVGVNDVNAAIRQKANNTAASFEQQYDTLLEHTIKALPDCLLIVCEPFLLPVGRVKEDWPTWNSEMRQRQQIVRRLSEKYKAVFVPLQEVFNKAATNPSADYWIWDGIHPTVPGHELITKQWLKQVGNKISFLKKYSACQFNSR